MAAQQEVTAHIQSVVSVPAVWGTSYSHDDKKAVVEIINWLNTGQDHRPGYQHQRSQTKLAKAAKINASTLNTILQGKYPSPPGKQLSAVLDTIGRQAQREQQGIGHIAFVETSVYRTVLAACKRAHMYRNFAVVSAYVGTGKTTAVKRYAQLHANVILVEADPDMNASVLVNTLVEMTGAFVHRVNKYSEGTKSEKMAGIINRLKGTDSLLILDEAETVTTQTLEYLRRISDKAGIGVVLSGTEKLQPMIRDPRGKFGQISSRVSFWPPVIKSIEPQDARAIVTAALEDDGIELTDAIHDAFWQMCDGSARVLANSLIPGVRDYGLRRGHALTADLIYEAGQKVLGFSRPKGGAR